MGAKDVAPFRHLRNQPKHKAQGGITTQPDSKLAGAGVQEASVPKGTGDKTNLNIPFDEEEETEPIPLNKPCFKFLAEDCRPKL